MREASEVAKVASREIESWLRRREETVSLQNVEKDPTYQKGDIDLIWTTRNRTFRIEIKGDRWHRTGNFFFETASNKERATPGCLLYTKADYVFYYFVTPRILYCLPMPATMKWFSANLTRFKQRCTTTPVGKHYYTTVGRLVPISAVVKEVGGVRKVNLVQQGHAVKQS